MSVRNQLTHYKLEEFFRSLQDLLVLSLKDVRANSVSAHPYCARKFTCMPGHPSSVHAKF